MRSTGDTDTASLDVNHTPGTLTVDKQVDADQDGLTTRPTATTSPSSTGARSPMATS